MKIKLEKKHEELETCLRKEIEVLKQALERACEWHENTCPINELSLTGPYPEWCQFVADADGEPINCRHWQGSYECWMMYYIEGMEKMK